MGLQNNARDHNYFTILLVPSNIYRFICKINVTLAFKRCKVYIVKLDFIQYKYIYIYIYVYTYTNVNLCRVRTELKKKILQSSHSKYRSQYLSGFFLLYIFILQQICVIFQLTNIVFFVFISTGITIYYIRLWLYLYEYNTKEKNVKKLDKKKQVNCNC